MYWKSNVNDFIGGHIYVYHVDVLKSAIVQAVRIISLYRLHLYIPYKSTLSVYVPYCMRKKTAIALNTRHRRTNIAWVCFKHQTATRDELFGVIMYKAGVIRQVDDIKHDPQTPTSCPV